MGIIDNPNIFADKYRVASSRKTNWNYSSSGIYFITVCTYRHNNFFGKIINNQMELSKMGIIVNQCLIDIPKHFPNIILNEYVIMPNHVHLLIRLNNRRDVACNVSTTQHNINKKDEYFSKISPRPNSIPTIIRSFKSAVTRQINPKTIFFAWQPRYHDIIIKNKQQYFTIKNYIQNNVINWEKDKFYAV